MQQSESAQHPDSGRGAAAHAPSSTPSFVLSPPAPALPKGGGAMRGIGEKFSAQPAMGTGSMSVPLPISPGRSGFQPSLALQYDSGAGNGIFGLGWQLNLATITRKTEKGLPRYQDAQASDTFLIAGAEDLVPVTETGAHAMAPQSTVRLGGRTYRVQRYRPRIEGLFAWIERWTGSTDPADSFWRVIDRGNTSQWFGRSAASRIADPADPTRIFQWLPCETHDDKGNVIAYDYIADDEASVDTGAAWERHRSAEARGAQRYIKRVRYGNRAPYRPTLARDQPAPELPRDWMFELVFDYGDHDRTDPGPAADRPWALRPDAFSDYRAGFERRTSRRVERVLMFHHFPEVPELGSAALVRSLRIRYTSTGRQADPTQAGYSQIEALEPWAHERQTDGRIISRQTPPVEFRYSPPRIDPGLRSLNAADLPGLPVGTQGPGYQWVDLDGEGLAGILSEDAGAWRYAANLGEGRFAASREVARTPARRALSAGQRLMDLEGNGEIDVVEFDGPMPGHYERERAADWKRFVPFALLPRVDWNDPNLRLLDLTGDGHADALITEDDVFTWYPSLAGRGFDAAERARPPPHEGLRLVFADGTQTLFLADMSGDGLTDIVRIRNGQVCYWPNRGYGRFGAKVQMGNAPRFDHEEQFDPQRIRLADIDGSGPTDILYLGRQGVQIYFNRSGNTWSDPQALDFPLATHNLAAVQVADLLGRGTACLVWNSHLPADAATPVRYIDLMSGGKPHLLVKTRNNLGGSTEIEYTPSTHFYLADQAAGTPWITRLPFAVQCVSRVTVRDAWRGTAFSSRYSYHHGCFDGVEREFRGFGRVEQVDVEDYGVFEQTNAASPWITEDRRLYQPPVKTVTWYHTGVTMERSRVLTQFEREYFPARYRLEGDFRERALPEPQLDPGLDLAEWQEALRACKGMVLRQEVYELDIAALTGPTARQRPVRLYSAATRNCRVQRLQARGVQRHAVFLVTESEALNYEYEQPLPEPGGTVRADPRISHTLTLRVDELGQALQTVTVGYPRIRPHEDEALDDAAVGRIRAVQAERHLAYAEARFTADLVLPAAGGSDAALRHYRLRLPCETLSHELGGISPGADTYYFEPGDFAALRLSESYAPLDASMVPVDVQELPYHRVLHAGGPQRRLVEHARTLYFDDAADDAAPVTALPLGRHGPRGLKYEDYRLALTDDLLSAVFQTPADLPHMPAGMLDWELRPGVSARALLEDARISGYQRDAAAGMYWLRSGSAGFAPDAARHFYLPERYTDAFGALTILDYDALDLYVRSVTDARGNRSEVQRFDYRTLTPTEMVDANGNHTQACIDVLGQTVAVATKGKLRDGSWEGDDLQAFESDGALRDPDPAEVQDFATAHTLDETRARTWLARASSRHIYHFGEQRAADGTVLAWAVRPAMACAIAREVHAGQPGGESSPLQVALQCSDGSGEVLMAKQQAEPETGVGPLRWIVNGLTVLNNKGKPVKQYEPFFSDRFGCELPREEGVATIISYDAAGRVLRSDAPDGTFSRMEFSPWYTRQFDAADTVLQSTWYAERGSPDPAAPLPRGVDGRVTASAEWHAAWLAAKLADTPGQTHLDSLGRAVIAIAHQRTPDVSARPLIDWSVAEWAWRDEFHLTHTRLDAEGKPLWVRDARGNLVMQHIHPPKAASDVHDDLPIGSVPAYDIAGNLLYQYSMDAGARWMLSDATGQPLLAWDLNEVLDAAGRPLPEARLAHTQYDALRRPLRQWLRLGEAAAAVIERFDYRDSADAAAGVDLADARARNLIGKTIAHEDPSGRIEVRRVDFAGRIEHETRRLTRHSTSRVIDWQASESEREGLLETEVFTRHTSYDALGRMRLLANWHRRSEHVAVYRPAYNRRGLLEAEELSLGAQWNDDAPSGGTSWRAVHGIAYNARGQRTRLRHGNGTETRYAYDARNFRLVQLRTTRPATELPFPGFRSNLGDARVLQQLHYSYDAAGNISQIEDEAWAPVFFRNQAVEPRKLYVYDALNRLIEATGRESATLKGAPAASSEAFSAGSFPADHPLRNYRQRYAYDAVGNFITMQHQADGGSWTRHYQTAAHSNRLLRSETGSDPASAVDYAYDSHGSMLNLVNVADAARLQWNWNDMIQGLNLVGGGHAWYSYDLAKQRTRKRIERLGGTVEERLYLGGMELYRRHAPSGDLLEEIETHHLFVDNQRVLLVDEVLATDSVALGTGVLMRYQYGNHLGSVALELDETAQVLGCEEFHPYGTVAYQLRDSTVRATAKRYRYTGMERDEETGMGYHTARYYMPWLCRWASTDPTDLNGGINFYLYAGSNPISMSDIAGTQPARSPGCSGVRCLMLTEPGDMTFAGIEAGRLAAELNFIAQHDPLATETPWTETPVEHMENMLRFTALVDRGLIVFDEEAGRFRGNLRALEGFDRLMQQEDFAHAFAVALSERWDELELDLFVDALIFTPLQLGFDALFPLVLARAGGVLRWLAMAPATRRLVAEDARLAAEYAERALARAAATAYTPAGSSVVQRTITSATGEEVFMHRTISADAPHTAESAALSIAESQSIRVSTAGSRAIYGEGVYAYEEGAAAATGTSPEVTFSVPAGTAIERIVIPGQRTIVRLLPAEGSSLSIANATLNLSAEQLLAGTTLLRMLQRLR